MSDKLMQTLAKLQTENRKLKEQDKIKDKKLNERDETIRIADEEYQKSLTKLKEEIQFKEKMIKSLTKKKGKK
tara:strand:+ start:82 stop:300 length:219 start_codon:yes stop_codon:yes gene_type:complete